MRNLLTIDIQDLSVMIGGGFFLSAVASVVWSGIVDTPAPPVLLLPVATAGFILGRILSFYSKRQ